MNIETLNIINIAYLGDAIYEAYIREKLIKESTKKVEELQKHAINYVSAKSQAKILQDLLDRNILTEEEINIVKRGRNYKRSSHPKHTDIITYKLSTGFEALIGYLYLTNRKERLQTILEEIEVK